MSDHVLRPLSTPRDFYSFLIYVSEHSVIVPKLASSLKSALPLPLDAVIVVVLPFV